MLTSNQLTILHEICDELNAMLDSQSDVMLGDGPTPIKVMTEITRTALRAATTQILGVLDSAREFDNLERFARIMFGSKEGEARVIQRAQLINVLLGHLDESRTKMTVRRFNSIITDLGFRLPETGPFVTLGDDVFASREAIEKADFS